ncbi:MAG: DUF4040 domain-containing protein [Defluviitaleaceae bacterium]|nr:DUF4040 domain-containing protein [Defluviitaleaceae bacterium]
MSADYILYALMGITAISILMIMFERKVYRIIIYTAIFSLIISGIYLVLGSPDVAMAEAAIGAYAIIFMIVMAEKYYKRDKTDAEGKKKAPVVISKASSSLPQVLGGLVFVGALAALFVHFAPTSVEANLELRTDYLLRAGDEVGGQNVIGAILMAYRLYDTLFEALLLVIAIMAVSHLSWLGKDYITKGRKSDIQKDKVAFYSIRIISPLILMFGIYLVANGHISAGGGFQGGLAIACFFICRYMIHDIYDMPVKKVLKMEEIVFMALVIVAVLTIFLNVDVPYQHTVLFQNFQLIAANALVGVKVACGFFILFYRYITIERTEKLEK